MSSPTPVTACVAFDKLLRDWDGFGCNYVEMSHTLDGKYEDYGSFSEMADEDIETILSMIFGPDGLRTHVVKIFLNPYLLDRPPAPGQIDLDTYRFDDYMPQIIHFAQEGIRRSKEQGINLRFFIINPDRSFTVNQSYYYYKQISLAGQGGMAVAEANCADPDIYLMAFNKNGTDHRDALVAVNRSSESRVLHFEMCGSSGEFTVRRTTMQEQFVTLDDASVINGYLQYEAPPESVTTFFEKLY